LFRKDRLVPNISGNWKANRYSAEVKKRGSRERENQTKAAAARSGVGQILSVTEVPNYFAAASALMPWKAGDRKTNGNSGEATKRASCAKTK